MFASWIAIKYYFNIEKVNVLLMHHDGFLFLKINRYCCVALGSIQVWLVKNKNKTNCKGWRCLKLQALRVADEKKNI